MPPLHWSRTRKHAPPHPVSRSLMGLCPRVTVLRVGSTSPSSDCQGAGPTACPGSHHHPPLMAMSWPCFHCTPVRAAQPPLGRPLSSLLGRQGRGNPVGDQSPTFHPTGAEEMWDRDRVSGGAVGQGQAVPCRSSTRVSDSPARLQGSLWSGQHYS